MTAEYTRQRYQHSSAGVFDESYRLLYTDNCFPIHFYSAPVEERSIAVSLTVYLRVCVCLSVSAYLWNRWTELYEILCAESLWTLLDPPLAALRYVMYFRFLDDVIFGRNVPYGDAWKAEPLTYSTTSVVAIPGRSHVHEYLVIFNISCIFLFER